MLFLFENYALDTDRRELRRGASAVSVEPQVFDLLAYLLKHRDRVASKDDLIAAIWGGRIVSDSTLTTRINAVRRAISDTGEEQRLIRTLPRKGMRFVGAVREEQKPDEAAATHAPVEQPGSALPLPDRPSIAVLPFINMSSGPEQDYFADGMVEEIITALARCSWLLVIARNSSFAYKGKPVDVRQVGRELGVRYVLEGSVRRAGDRLRFTGQLIDATTGTHIWADRFEGNVGDLFDLQDQLTASVVAAIEPKLQLAEIERLKHKRPTNLDAYDLLLRAQQLEHQFTEESLAAALCHLEHALVIDPTYAPAMEEGLRLAVRAVELGEDDGNVFWMAAYAVFRLQKDAHRAREFARHALQLNPNSANALAELGRIEAFFGNSDKALELLVRAERLGPRDPRGWFVKMQLAMAYYLAGQYEEAASAAKKALSEKPRFVPALRHMAACLAKQGRQSEATQVMREALQIEPQLTLTKVRARVLLKEESEWHDYSAALRLAGLPE